MPALMFVMFHPDVRSRARLEDSLDEERLRGWAESRREDQGVHRGQAALHLHLAVPQNKAGVSWVMCHVTLHVSWWGRGMVAAPGDWFVASGVSICDEPD